MMKKYLEELGGNTLAEVFAIFRRHKLTDEEITTIWTGIHAWYKTGLYDQNGHAPNSLPHTTDDSIEGD